MALQNHIEEDVDYEVRMAGKNSAGRGEWVKQTIYLGIEVDWRPLTDDEWRHSKKGN